MEGVTNRHDFPRISLAAARVNAGFTQAVAAERLGIGAKTLCMYESGQRKPKWDVVISMSQLYGMPIDYLNVG